MSVQTVRLPMQVLEPSPLLFDLAAAATTAAAVVSPPPAALLPVAPRCAPFLREFASAHDLRAGMANVAKHTVQHLVAHRGFHCVSDGTHRPIENTVEAMREAWTNGVRLCECDITLSADGQLVLCHDSNFARLAEPSSPFPALSSSPVTSLALDSIRSIPLRNDSRVATLLEVLECAHVLGAMAAESGEDQHQPGLVVEVKHGASDSAVALVDFLWTFPHLAKHVAVVMSFDHDVIRDFAREFARRDALHPAPHRPSIMLLMLRDNSKAREDPFEKELQIGAGDELDELAARTLQLLDVDANTPRLDGVYLQFDARLLGSAARLFDALCAKCCVGVWDAPDNVPMVETLVHAGATFVNSDLPASFGH